MHSYVMKNRSRIEIINMMLDSARSGATKTQIMYKAYLSYSQLVEYIEYLQQNGLITHNKGMQQLYRPTKKGLKFLNLSAKLNQMTFATKLVKS